MCSAFGDLVRGGDLFPFPGCSFLKYCIGVVFPFLRIGPWRSPPLAAVPAALGEWYGGKHFFTFV